jgi:hypothetical protein
MSEIVWLDKPLVRFTGLPFDYYYNDHSYISIETGELFYLDEYIGDFEMYIIHSINDSVKRYFDARFIEVQKEYCGI